MIQGSRARASAVLLALGLAILGCESKKEPAKTTSPPEENSKTPAQTEEKKPETPAFSTRVLGAARRRLTPSAWALVERTNHPGEWKPDAKEEWIARLEREYAALGRPEVRPYFVELFRLLRDESGSVPRVIPRCVLEQFDDPRIPARERIRLLDEPAPATPSRDDPWLDVLRAAFLRSDEDAELRGRALSLFLASAEPDAETLKEILVVGTREELAPLALPMIPSWIRRSRARDRESLTKTAADALEAIAKDARRDPGVRWTSVGSYAGFALKGGEGESDPWTEKLVTWTSAEDPLLRCAALAALAPLSPERARDPMEALLRSEEPKLREAAVYAWTRGRFEQPETAKKVEEASVRLWEELRSPIALRALSEAARRLRRAEAWEALLGLAVQDHRALLAAVVTHRGLELAADPSERREDALLEAIAARLQSGARPEEESEWLACVSLIGLRALRKGSRMRLQGESIDALDAHQWIYDADPATRKGVEERRIRKGLPTTGSPVRSPAMAALHKGGVPLSLALSFWTGDAEADRLTREAMALLLVWQSESARWPELAGGRARRDPALPPYAVARLGVTDGVRALAFSRDGARLYVGDDAGLVPSWESPWTRRLPPLKAHGGRVVSLAFSTDGKTLASAGMDDRVKVWESGSGRLIATFARRGAPVYPPRISLGFGDTTVACGSGMDVLIWDYAKVREVRRIRIGEFHITSVSHAPDGKRLASADGYGNVHVWDLATGKDVWTTPVSGAMYVVFSPKGDRIAGWGVGEEVALWNADSGAALEVLKVPRPSASGLCFSPDGTLLASGGEDGTVRIWDLGSRSEVLRRIGHAAPVTSVAFSPDGRTLASADERGSVFLWDVSRP